MTGEIQNWTRIGQRRGDQGNVGTEQNQSGSGQGRRVLHPGHCQRDAERGGNSLNAGQEQDRDSAGEASAKVGLGQGRSVQEPGPRWDRAGATS